MRRGKNDQTVGQLLYELMASKDKTSQYWPEWRDLSGEIKDFYENAALKLVQQSEQDQEDSDS
jgi:hypothetical protein